MSATSAWSIDRLPSLDDRIAVITGGNSGIGFETALALSRAGAKVVLACRNTEKASAAVERIRQVHTRGTLDTAALDLADLASIRQFAESFCESHSQLHYLFNNAGVMAIPRVETRDGFEMQIGTNHLGHFALTSRLLPALLATADARVVSVSSMAHWAGRIRLDDLFGSRSYGKWSAYAQSKLANLLFTRELQRRFAESGAAALALAVHPGYAATGLQGASADAANSGLWSNLFKIGNGLVAQSAAAGALPSLYAACAPDLEGADYIGPDTLSSWGAPARARMSRRARDSAMASDLWDLSSSLTATPYEFS